jgi:hypothetical protein
MGERFELERFEWQAPDRLEIAGKFHGLEQAPADKPVLCVSGGGEAHRLKALGEIVPSTLEDGKPWRAQFVWDQTPVGVEAAALEFGSEMVVDLPAPGAKQTLLRPHFIKVRRAQDDEPADDAPAQQDAPADEAPAQQDAPADEAPAEQDASADEPPAEPDAPAEAEGEPQVPAAGGDVALEADLVAAEARIQELRAALERTEAELSRARADLEAERDGRAQDAERFREGLARVRTSAEQSLAAAQGEAQQLAEQGEAARAELSSQLEAAEAARTQADTEAATLREQVAAADELRKRLCTFENAGAEAVQMRAEAQRLLKRLTKLVEALDAGK